MELSLNYTKKSFVLFINALAQPARFLDWLDYNIPMTGVELDRYRKSNFWKESVLWAWAFKCLGVLLELIVLCFFIEYLALSDLDFSSFDFFVSQSGYLTSFSLTFIFLGLSLLCFPIAIVFNNLIIMLFVKATLGLVDGKKTAHLKLWESIGLSNTSYFYHLVPFLGSMAQRIAQFILLYTMLRWKLKWGRAKTTLVLVAPGILFSIGIMLVVILFLVI